MGDKKESPSQEQVAKEGPMPSVKEKEGEMVPENGQLDGEQSLSMTPAVSQVDEKVAGNPFESLPPMGDKKQNPSQEQVVKESEPASKAADLVEPSMPEEGNKETAEIEKVSRQPLADERPRVQEAAAVAKAAWLESLDALRGFSQTGVVSFSLAFYL